MRNYELLFILDPTLEEEKKNATIETVKGIINNDGVAGEVDVWGSRKLAYPIEKKNEGYYVVLYFQANPELPKELDRRLKISDNIMRHIIVCQDEDEAQAAIARSKERPAKPEVKAEAPAEETPVETEAPAEAPVEAEAPAEAAAETEAPAEDAAETNAEA